MKKHSLPPPSELEIVADLCRRFSLSSSVKLGPGDDAAILAWDKAADMVISTDLLTEGVDFLLERVMPQKIARKALAVNLSDLAAMAAEPVACVISVALPEKPRIFPGEYDADGNLTRWMRYRDEKPRRVSVPELMEKLAEGFQEIAEEFHIQIVGGDTNTWRQSLVISVTVIGRTQFPSSGGGPEGRGGEIPLLWRGGGAADGVVGAASQGDSDHPALTGTPPEEGNFAPLLRKNAKPGDKILVTGALGGSILRKQFTFTPRVYEMMFLTRKYPIRAGMDISDGLALDLWRLTRASGCGAILDPKRIPISADARELSALDVTHSRTHDWIPAEFAAKTPLEHALTDGEDFEILFTAPPEIADRILTENPLGDIPITHIGEITPDPGLWLRTRTGGRKPLKAEGFTHG